MSIFSKLFGKKKNANPSTRKAVHSDAGDFDIADIVQRMFDEAGMDGHRQDNMFLALTDGTNTTFKTVLLCDKHSLLVYSPFPIPVPKDVTHCVAMEMNAINASSNEARLSMKPSDEKDMYSLVAITNRDFLSVQPLWR